MQTGKSLAILVAIALGAASLGGVASAANNGAGPTGNGPGWGGPGRCGGYGDEARLDILKKELAITPDQEAAWTTYTKAVQDNWKQWYADQSNFDPSTIRGMSLQDRRAFMEKRFEEDVKHEDALKAAAQALLPKLTEYQKGQANEILPGLVSWGRGAGWHGGGMGGYGGMMGGYGGMGGGYGGMGGRW